MIKYDYTASPDFLAKYKANVVLPTQQRMAEYLRLVPKPFATSYNKFFNQSFVADLLLARPNNLVDLINKIYTAFPELADRYWPAFLLKSLPVPEDIDTLKARTADDKKRLDAICIETVKFLSQPIFYNCSFIKHIKSEIENAHDYISRRKYLKKLSLAACGQVDTRGDYLNIFPAWVEAFSSVFSYSDFSRKLGLSLVKEWEIDFCLYCNNEGIQTRGKKTEYRAALDHFHPQSKFPFLAVTLSNLVPSGGICNSAYKKDKDMIDFAHPYVSGVTGQTLFFIDYPAGEKIAANNYSVRVMPQGGNIDRSLQEFEIAHLYSNDREMRHWLCATFETVEWALGYGEIPRHIINQIVDISKPPHAVRAKKFKIDTVNQFAGKALLSFP
ncbi:hypothetical protein [Stutzerimonas stutzeri]|uniref:hypothetical protein n=1 Tax=Stutzerimonas stutzeri TaxID=316 RepID=UPI0017842A52|nr:hypothetical protein [Stutzerimonas stutzeri]MBD9412127.1 hypothetical protein [Stutzerimonas stutzeri]